MTETDARIVRRPNLSAQVYDAIRDSIMSGELKGGQRVVVERIAADLGVSPTPVREALARLIQEGIVEGISPGRLQVVQLTESYVLDTYFVRGTLEGLAAELAAPKISKDDLEMLAFHVSEASAALDREDYATYADSDRCIHLLICEAACNPVLSRQLESLHSHIGFIRDYSYRHVGDQLVKSQSEHIPILDALSNRDVERSRVLVESHIRNSGIRIAEIVADEQRAKAAATQN